jgi:MFS family permease
MQAIHPLSSAIRHRDPPTGQAVDSTRTYRIGFWLIAGAFALAMAFSAAPAPIYPLYENRDRFGPFTVTLVFAVYAVGVVLSLFLGGHVSDWLGRRRMLLTTFAVLVTAAVVFLAWPELPGLFIARFLTGLGIGIISPTATAHLHELDIGHRPDSGHNRSAVVSSIANVGGLGVGPLITGVLAQYAPAPLRVPYVAFAALLTLSALAVAFTPETVAIPPERPRYRPQRISAGCGEPAAYIAAAAGAVTACAVFSLFASLAPGFMAGTLHHPARGLAGIVVFFVFATAALAQALSGRIAPRTCLSLGIIFQAAGLITLAISLRSPNLVTFLGGGALAVGGGGLLFKAAVSTVAALAPRSRRGEALAGLYFIAYLGLIIPTLGMGILTQHLGAPAAILWFAGVLLVVLAVIAALGHSSVSRRSRLDRPRPAAGPRRVPAGGGREEEGRR